MDLSYKIITVIICIFLITACSSNKFHAPVTDENHPALQQGSDRYIVRQGDTLYSVAWSVGQDYRVLAQINHISPPYRIRSGQVILTKSAHMPVYAPSSHTRTFALGTTEVIKSTKPKPTVSYQVHAQPPKRQTVIEPETNIITKITGWRWPTKGALIRSYHPSQGSKGIDIAGTMGQAVVAAGKGEVVYSGAGLRGYGKLIIIKHNAEYLSAYAHNRVVLVKEGQIVSSGQKIAEMGDTGADRVKLHFEIRRAGKPVDPLMYLSKK